MGKVFMFGSGDKSETEEEKIRWWGKRRWNRNAWNWTGSDSTGGAAKHPLNSIPAFRRPAALTICAVYGLLNALPTDKTFQPISKFPTFSNTSQREENNVAKRCQPTSTPLLSPFHSRHIEKQCSSGIAQCGFGCRTAHTDTESEGVGSDDRKPNQSSRLEENYLHIATRKHTYVWVPRPRISARTVRP